MADPAQVDIIVPSRQVPWSDTFVFLGEDWTGSSLLLQVRQVPGTTGAPLIARSTGAGLSIPYAGTDTVANHILAGRITAEVKDLVNPLTGANYADADNLTLTQAFVSFDVGNLNAIPARTDGETGDPVVVYYDMIRTPLTGDPLIAMNGSLTVEPGVTIP